MMPLLADLIADWTFVIETSWQTVLEFLVFSYTSTVYRSCALPIYKITTIIVTE